MSRGAVVWVTGLPAAGKTTLARALHARLAAAGRPAHVLDGDELRTGLCAGLGFSAADRRENVRRAACAARILADAGVVAIAALVSPYRADRAMAREACSPHLFLEVFVDTPLAECERRDPKGLYHRARRGELRGMTGIDDPYEAPEPEAALVVHGSTQPEATAELILRLVDRELAGQPGEP